MRAQLHGAGLVTRASRRRAPRAAPPAVGRIGDACSAAGRAASPCRSSSSRPWRAGTTPIWSTRAATCSRTARTSCRRNCRSSRALRAPRRRSSPRYLAVQGRIVEAGLRLTSLKLDARGAWELELDNGVTVRFGRRQVDERFERFLAWRCAWSASAPPTSPTSTCATPTVSRSAGGAARRACASGATAKGKADG